MKKRSALSYKNITIILIFLLCACIIGSILLSVYILKNEAWDLLTLSLCTIGFTFFILTYFVFRAPSEAINYENKGYKEASKLFKGIIIALGIVCTVISFLLYFLNHDLVWIMYPIDICFLLFNGYIFSELLAESKKKAISGSFLISIDYIVVFSAIGCLIFESSITPELFIKVLQFAIFVGPVLIIVSPIIYLICLAIGG